MTAEIARYYADWSALGIASPTMETAFRWIREHAHEAIGPRKLVHGDFSLSNVMISEEGTVSAILDWEFAQLGFPAADIGWFLLQLSISQVSRNSSLLIGPPVDPRRPRSRLISSFSGACCALQ